MQVSVAMGGVWMILCLVVRDPHAAAGSPCVNICDVNASSTFHSRMAGGFPVEKDCLRIVGFPCPLSASLLWSEWAVCALVSLYPQMPHCRGSFLSDATSPSGSGEGAVGPVGPALGPRLSQLSRLGCPIHPDWETEHREECKGPFCSHFFG